jgi:hypothetical protein
MPKLPLPRPLTQRLSRFSPPKPPSAAELAKRAEGAFIRFNQGPCVDGKAHVFKTQPFPPYAREFCAKCGVDKDDLATYRNNLRVYHGVGERLWSGAPALSAIAVPHVTRRRADLWAPLAVAAGVVLLGVGIALLWPPLASSGPGMFLLLAGFAISIVAGIAWAATGGAKSRQGS